MWRENHKVLTLQLHPVIESAMEVYRKKTGCPKSHIVRLALMEFLGVKDLTIDTYKLGEQVTSTPTN